MSRRIAFLGLAAALLIAGCASVERPLAAQPLAFAPASQNFAPSAQGQISRIQLGPDVAARQLIHRVDPLYPAEAKANGVSGTVVLHVIVAKDGSLKDVQVVSGPPSLTDPAGHAVRQWVYKPFLLNGEPVEVDTTVSVVFALDANAPAAPAASSSDDKAIDPQLRADILHLLLTMKGLEAAEAGIRTTFDSLRPQLEAALPRTPNREKIIDAYEEKLVALVRQPEFQDGIVAIYAKHLSDDDVKAIDMFYQTPAGQHFVAQLPVIVNESGALGQQAATDGIPRILGELCQEYPELKGQADFCPGDKDKQSQLARPRTAPPSRQFPPATPEGN